MSYGPGREPSSDGDPRAHNLVRAAPACLAATVARRVMRTQSVACTLVFGSTARGTATDGSDLDLIVLLSRSRAHNAALYTKVVVDGRRVDLNLVDGNDVQRLLREPSWQYRFSDATPVRCNPQADSAVLEWIDTLKRWIRSKLAREHRVEVLAGRTREITREFLNQQTRGRRGRSRYLAAQALRLWLLLACELSSVLPFSEGNPLELAYRLAEPDLLDTCWPLRGGVGRLRSDVRGSWLELDTLLSSARDVVAALDARFCDGSDEAAVLPTLAISEDVEHELESVFERVDWDDGRAHDMVRVTQSRLGGIRQKGGRRASGSLARMVEFSRQQASASTVPRHRSYDAERRRLKLIVPTGGCTVRTCTFCELPRLALPGPRPDWRTLLMCPEGRTDEVVVYTDGSFFDDAELTDPERRQAAQCAHELGARKLVVESLPRFMTSPRLAGVLGACGDSLRLVVGIGVQSMDSRIRSLLLGTPLEEQELDGILAQHSKLGYRLRLYLLYGKPLLTSLEDIEDLRLSVQRLSPYLGEGDTVTVNQLLPTRNTVVGRLEAAGLYRQADLCALRELIEELQQRYRTFTITPGCVSVRTGAPGTAEADSTCEMCMRWLQGRERGTTATVTACSAEPRFATCLPWSVFGRLERRCRFAERSADEFLPLPHCTSEKGERER